MAKESVGGWVSATMVVVVADVDDADGEGVVELVGDGVGEEEAEAVVLGEF